MPKVISSEQVKREHAFWEFVDSKIGEGEEYRFDYEFAEKVLGFTDRGFSKWRTGGLPRFFQSLCRIFQATRITDRQLCRIFGVEYKGDDYRARNPGGACPDCAEGTHELGS